MEEPDMPQMGWGLALAGYLPFAGLVILLFALGPSHPLQTFATDALKVYAAIILSFLGGIRWGVAIAGRAGTHGPRDLALSIVPSLVGWFAVFLPAPWSFAVLAAAFAGQGA